MSMINTTYDDVFRTLLTDCRKLIIPVVNEVFHEQYDGTQEVVLFQNEIFMRQQDGEEEKRITDSSFSVISIDGTSKRYHLECQSTTDGSMLIRMYEYDSQIALSDGVMESGVLTVNFPKSAILYLRHSSKTPDYLTIRINVPGGSISYDVPTLKVKQYDINTIFERKLYFLIPFYIFTFEANLSEINEDGQKLRLLQQEYVDILAKLTVVTEAGIISEYTKQTICEMVNRVIKSIAAKYENIIKEVSEIMGGKVLEYEAKTILNQGREEGTFNTLVSLVKDGLLAIEEAAKRAGMSLEEFEEQMKEK